MQSGTHIKYLLIQPGTHVKMNSTENNQDEKWLE